jgi:hypothetical protein
MECCSTSVHCPEIGPPCGSPTIPHCNCPVADPANSNCAEMTASESSTSLLGRFHMLLHLRQTPHTAISPRQQMFVGGLGFYTSGS